jgi:hypothetical protein
MEPAERERYCSLQALNMLTVIHKIENAHKPWETHSDPNGDIRLKKARLEELLKLDTENCFSEKKIKDLDIIKKLNYEDKVRYYFRKWTNYW